jgi:hypothetical protein
MERTYSGLKRQGRPDGDTLAVIGEVLSQRWRAAAKLSPTRLFWQAPARWLQLAIPLEVRPYQRTRGGRLIK